MKLYVLFLLEIIAGHQTFAENETIIDANLRLTQNLYKLRGISNFVISPLSTQFALNLLGFGARGNTAADIVKALGMPSEGMNQDCKDLKADLLNTTSYNFTIVNGVFIPSNYIITQKFADVARKCFNAKVENLDFSNNAQATNAINTWIEKATGGKIKNMVQEATLVNASGLVLINAIYYEAKFKLPVRLGLDKAEMYNYIGYGLPMMVTMLHFEGHELEYAECNVTDSKLVKLPLQGPNTSLVIMLPNTIRGYMELDRVPEKIFTKRHFVKRRIDVIMPRFGGETEPDLFSVAHALGIESEFKQGAADLSGIAGKPGELFLSVIKQKVFFSVAATGVAAAAATATKDGYKSDNLRSKGPPTMFVNHPYILLLEVNDIIVFAARIIYPLT